MAKIIKTTKKTVNKKSAPKMAARSLTTLSPAASSSSAINYYGSNSKARSAAYGRVMVFVEQSKTKHASR